MKIADVVLCVLFALSAVIQYNDPDPWGWMAVYALAAFFTGAAARGRFFPKALWVAAAGVLIWMVTLFPGFLDWIRMGTPSIVGQMKAETPYIEVVREFLGLLLVFLALMFVYWQGRRKS